MSSFANPDADEELKQKMVEIAAESEDPLEPWKLVELTVEGSSASSTDARRTLRTLTHGKRTERELVHVLDGRIETAE